MPSSRRRVACTAVHKEAHLDYLYGVPFVILDKEALGTDGYIHRTWTGLELELLPNTLGLCAGTAGS